MFFHLKLEPTRLHSLTPLGLFFNSTHADSHIYTFLFLYFTHIHPWFFFTVWGKKKKSTELFVCLFITFISVCLTWYGFSFQIFAGYRETTAQETELTFERNWNYKQGKDYSMEQDVIGEQQLQLERMEGFYEDVKRTRLTNSDNRIVSEPLSDARDSR